ncbi:hypothetical protein ZIOFF_027721 [Zingiber officinale]|uniref:Ninja-family protein n=1 Tax=Zingiber officinale TaxID=94328 RepID=A0A8J5GTU8_ZINOF|nr:hypothetical protein ZIOFF_027721 [Zingiber officinale]
MGPYGTDSSSITDRTIGRPIMATEDASNGDRSVHVFYSSGYRWEKEFRQAAGPGDAIAGDVSQPAESSGDLPALSRDDDVTIPPADNRHASHDGATCPHVLAVISRLIVAYADMKRREGGRAHKKSGGRKQSSPFTRAEGQQDDERGSSFRSSTRVITPTRGPTGGVVEESSRRLFRDNASRSRPPSRGSNGLSVLDACRAVMNPGDVEGVSGSPKRHTAGAHLRPLLLCFFFASFARLRPPSSSSSVFFSNGVGGLFHSSLNHLQLLKGLICFIRRGKIFTLCFLRRRFVGEPTEVTEGDTGEIELSLGLSLGGCFGADPKGKKLVRSSSVVSFLTLPREPEFPAVSATALTRTSSLPTETEEELRKRKQIQSLKRLEAKRKRLERKNSVRSGKPGDNPDEDVSGGKGLTASASEQTVANNVHLGSKGGSYLCTRNGVTRHGRPTWAVAQPLKMAATRPADVPVAFPPISQGSIGSQGSCISCTADLETAASQDAKLFANSMSFTKIHLVYDSKTELFLPKSQACSSIFFSLNTACSLPGSRSSMLHSAGNSNKNNDTATNPPASCAGKTQLSPRSEDRARPKAAGPRANGAKEMERKMMEKMPFVSTQGEGPNGRRVEGFLYKYRKGEEVRIVCVCHGSFLTPAEFVKHAGGLDVTNPLRHIVVNSSPFAL